MAVDGILGTPRPKNDAPLLYSATAINQYGPAHPFWFLMTPGQRTKSGTFVTPENAMEVSAVYACVTLLSETIASLPLKVYENTANGKREKTEGKLYNLLRNPVAYQNQFEWVENLVGYLALRGNSVHRIGPMRSELDPIHPDSVDKVELGDSRRLTYTINIDGEPIPFDQQEIFHVKGLASDGIWGMSPVSLARETIGVAKAAEEHGGKFFGNSSIPGGIISTENRLDPESKQRLRHDFEKMHSGDNQYRVGVFDTAMKWQQVGLSNEDAQFLETRKFEIAEIARWFRIPPHMIGDVERSTSWGTGIEQQSIGFVRYTLRPWLKRIEAAINASIVLPNDGPVYVKFNVEGLLRGDSAARSAYYRTAIGGPGAGPGWMTVEEVRLLEDMNPEPEQGELQKGEQPEPEPMPEPEPEEQEEAHHAHPRMIPFWCADIAQRLVSCERNAFDKRLKHASEDPERFTEWADGWLTDHRERVASAMTHLWDALEMHPDCRDGMADNYIIGRRESIFGETPDAWDSEPVAEAIEKDLQQWIR